MASTTNKNSFGNYQAEQYGFQKINNYDQYLGRVINQQTLLPGDGLLSGKMPNTVLSNNSTNIESELFGIGSTNLVSRKELVQPEIKTLKSLSIYDKPVIIIPEPLVVEKFQRPSRD
jgi:hypothetical protein